MCTFLDSYSFGVVREEGRTPGFLPDPWQQAVLDSRARRGLLCCSRQAGKSTVAALKALRLMQAEPGALVLAAAPTGRQAAELVRKAGEMAGGSVIGDGDNPISLMLPNRSRMVGLPGSKPRNLRGFSAVRMLILDEAAQIPDVLWRTLSPMLAVSGGSVWMLSTPFGKAGFFWECWEHGGGEWERFRVTGLECPRIPREFLEGERRSMGASWFAQEYLCEFVDAGGRMFGMELVMDALVDGEHLF